MTRPWIFSRSIDLAVFGAPALVALALVALAPSLGLAGADSPEWAWVVGVVLVDVAHVWSTALITYLDGTERARRPTLYALVPLLGWAAGVAVYAAAGPAGFWRALAYLAIFHFVRQQYGWVALYRARAGDRERLGGVIDGAMIYAATLYPLVWWHAAAPRRFAWFVPGDLAVGWPAAVATAAGVLYAAIAVAYLARAVAEARRRPVPWGKHLVVATTAACWYVGIVATDGDFTFTVTNVLIHGVPYVALVVLYGRAVAATTPTRPSLGARLLARPAVVVVATLWLVAFVEELLWDRAVWHDRPWLFGAGLELADLHVLVVPLLALPQLTHYVVDGFLWRRRSNPRVGLWFAGP
ncbi:MAG: hypothetical protein R3B06_11200 [Kofleriaceae bacterium]